MSEKLLDLKQDIVFQELFGKQKNSNITSHFLSLILGREIKDIDLDVNKRITIEDDISGIHGDYVISSITLPLDAESNMSISAIKALTRV